ncbi:unnamed protein product [Staurois parvus]|uniref:Uncharacterized protein n=1 Tax=Staurois parvus TaxID=386267 RepID=A0ABN9EH49_9NEOB|nr:unnamed protein product [Staurois parvus]
MPFTLMKGHSPRNMSVECMSGLTTHGVPSNRGTWSLCEISSKKAYEKDTGASHGAPY